MVAGMTPTVKAGFVSAVLDAGYHIELAGGGHYNPAAIGLQIHQQIRTTRKYSERTLSTLDFHLVEIGSY